MACPQRPRRPAELHGYDQTLRSELSPMTFSLQSAPDVGGRPVAGNGSERLTMKWEPIVGSTDLLTPTDGAFPPIVNHEAGLFTIGDEEPAQSVGGQSRSHTGPRYSTMSGPSGTCVQAYNFRNLSTGYFRGTSTKTGVCFYMMVALYRNSLAQGGAGFCLWSGFGGSSAALANFASHYTYTTPTYPADSDTCSAHTGWKSNWSQQVNARGMNGYPN